MQGILLAQILLITVCGALLIAKFKGKTNINAALFDSKFNTYCDWEICDKTFIAPKIIIAYLKFVEAHINTQPYRKQDQMEESISDAKELLAGPGVFKVWSDIYSSEEIYVKLEGYYKDGAVKPSTVANLIAQWHANFTKTYYKTNVAKEYISRVILSGKSFWADGTESKQCLKGMYLQIILHLFTIPEDQRKDAFYAIFGMHRSPPAAIIEYFGRINKIWNVYREEQINWYRTFSAPTISTSIYGDTMLQSLLLKYSAIPNFLCDPYDANIIRGPTQLGYALAKIKAEYAMVTRSLWVKSNKYLKNLEKLKSDFFMGHVTPSDKYDANTASVFATLVFSAIYSRLDLIENVQRKEGDVMDLLLKSLTQSGFNYCLIGGILRFFETFIYTTKRHFIDVAYEFQKMCTASYAKPNGDNIKYCGRNNTDRIVKLMTEPWQTSKAQSYWQSRQWENDAAAAAAQSIAEPTGNDGELRKEELYDMAEGSHVVDAVADKRKARTVDETAKTGPNMGVGESYTAQARQ